MLHPEKDLAGVQPRSLVGAPQTLLAGHDVNTTDWHNPRDVGLPHGRFNFDDFIDQLITFFEMLGPAAHVVAVCRPGAAALGGGDCGEGLASRAA